PLVRSSYRAGRLWAQAMTHRGQTLPPELTHLADTDTPRQEATSLPA
ncbi:MAG: lipoyl synthase, partial [Kineosporiaceae bacterium]